MNAPRHWIMVLPPILMLSGYAVTRFRWPLGALLLTVELALFPYSHYRQVPRGYRNLIGQLHLPARMLVSSGKGSRGEGAWIAEMSTAERYPASLVARSSKVLATSDWNGGQYRLLLDSPSAVARELDEIAIDIVVLDAPSLLGTPDHVLLEQAVERNPSWKKCASNMNLIAYCRAEPPAFARKPLVLDAGGRHVEENIGTGRRWRNATRLSIGVPTVPLKDGDGVSSPKAVVHSSWQLELENPTPRPKSNSF
jgi:hypothetical protein